MKREINHSAYNNNAYINHEKFKFTLYSEFLINGIDNDSGYYPN